MNKIKINITAIHHSFTNMTMVIKRVAILAVITNNREAAYQKKKQNYYFKFPGFHGFQNLYHLYIVVL